MTTGFDVICTCADFSPSRFAVTVIVPAVRVERTATRLIPSSVFRYRLLVELSLPLLYPPRQMPGPVQVKSTRASSVGQRWPFASTTSKSMSADVFAIRLKALRPDD